MIDERSVFAVTPSQLVEEKVNKKYRDRCTNKGDYIDYTSEAGQGSSCLPKVNVRSEPKA